MNLKELRDQLRRPGLRHRTGVWLMPTNLLGTERQIAARLNFEPLDLRTAFLDTLPPGTRYTGLTRPNGYLKLLQTLEDIGQSTHKQDCALIYHLDLLLSGVEVYGRDAFWQEVYNGLPYLSTALVLTLPKQAQKLFPAVLQAQWEHDNRLARDA